MDLKFNWVEKKTSGRGRDTSDSFVGISTIRNGKNSKGHIRRAAVISFYEKAMKKLRFMKGDLVEVGFDKTARLMAIKRTTSSKGYTLSKMGKQIRFQIMEEMYPFIHDESIYLEEDHYFEQDGMFIFNLSTFGIKIK